MEAENFSCKKQQVTSHTTMGCQCDTKGRGGMMSMLWLVLSDTNQVDVMNLCWKSAPPSTTHWVYRPKPAELQNVQPVIAHILILRPEMSVGAPREVISSTIIDPKWASSLQTFHTAGQICIYTDNMSDCLLKKKIKKVLLQLIFCFAGCAIFIQFYSQILLNFNTK